MLAQLRLSLCTQPERARALLEDSPEPLDEAGEDEVAALLSQVDRMQADLEGLATGAAMFFGVEAVGAPADVRAAGREPLLVSFEPASWVESQGERQIVVPRPGLEPGLAAAAAGPEYQTMDAGELSERFEELAQGIAGCDGVEPTAD